jgi:crossover junction endodeoxyribonuclease RusA
MSTFAVLGRPAPQGSKRHVGNGRMVEMSKHVEPWRLAVRHEARKHFDEPITGPVSVLMSFYLQAPKRIPTDRRGRPSTVPDLDKLVRATFDALTGVAFGDDSQVVSLFTDKHYASEDHAAGVVISVIPTGGVA